MANYHGFVFTIIQLMPTFDPKHIRIMGNAMRIIGSFLAIIRYFENSIMDKKKKKKISIGDHVNLSAIWEIIAFIMY